MLKCTVCGAENQFEFNEDKTYVKCNKCGKEYFGGYDELVEYNQEHINSNVDVVDKEVIKDIENMLRDTFKGNIHFKIK